MFSGRPNFTPKKSSLYFEHEVSSFCVDGHYIYYSEHERHCEVYRKNLITNELIKIGDERGSNYFHQPKLYLNKEDNILYVGETNSSGSALYYYNATTLELESFFAKDDYGITNRTRDIFHVGNDIFWGNRRFSDTNANQIIGRYGEKFLGSINYASKEIVSSFEGVFLADTYECIFNNSDTDFPYEYVLVTESYNIFFRASDVDQNIIRGVNYSLQ